LHGLTEEQVAEIRSTRQLPQALSVYAPTHSHLGGQLPGDPVDGLTSLILEAIEQSTRDNQSLERAFELRGLRLR
jgi:hypothetical protein